MDWDTYFMMLVYAVAMKSKDRMTNIGAVIVGPDNEIRSTGYNSFPKGINDTLEERQERPEKYYWFEHAERNACYNAAKMGVSINGCRIYTTGIPCADCARAVINSGLIEVIVDAGWESDNSEKWRESHLRSLKMFEEGGILVRYWKGTIPQILSRRNGEIRDIF